MAVQKQLGRMTKIIQASKLPELFNERGIWFHRFMISEQANDALNDDKISDGHQDRASNAVEVSHGYACLRSSFVAKLPFWSLKHLGP